jgi:hypothetical protein
MNRNAVILFLYLFLLSLDLSAQTDEYSGKWQMKIPPGATEPAVEIELHIASPERNTLFPAQLKFISERFNATYEILLVRKNQRQLSISRNKYAREEKPFSAGDWTITFNGTLDFSRNLKGEPLLSVNRLPAKKYGVMLPDLKKNSDPGTTTLKRIIHLLRTEEIILKKISSIPWKNEHTEPIIRPKLSPTYFGLLDTIHVKTRDGIINFSGNKKSVNDIISIVLNGKNILDQVAPGKYRPQEDILLDTGLNILTLFADNFYKSAPNKAKTELVFGTKKFKLDFTNKPDIAATSITVKIYYDHDNDQDTRFQHINFDDPIYKSLKRNEKIVASIVASSKQITLALWDDAVEDGDSVSININGKWIAKGFPVKKNPQFITVTLDPGPNTITFVADNLGSIPPNTSVLEIIDGKKRKSFTIETNLDQNNLIRILYDYKPVD